MLKLKITMNEAKIQSEKQYELSTIQSTLDAVFAQNSLSKMEDGLYTGTGKADDYAKFWSIIWSLAKKEWFMCNVKEWLWFNSDDGADETDFSVEDILAFCKENRVGASA